MENLFYFVKNVFLIFIISYVCSAVPSIQSYDNVIVHNSQPLYTSSKLTAVESSPDSYVTSIGAKYDANREYAPELAGIYAIYLNREQYGAQCDSYAQSSSLTDGDLQEAMSFANQQIQLYESANQQYLAIDPRGLNFSAYIFGAILQSRYNEFTTQYLMARFVINDLLSNYSNRHSNPLYFYFPNEIFFYFLQISVKK